MLSLSKLSFVRDEADALIKQNVMHKVGGMSAVEVFGGRIKTALRTIAQEPEILLFAVLQWLIIAVAYFVFVSIFYFIPDEVWQSAADNSDSSSTPADIVLLIWAVMVIGIASLPIGVLSACIPAVHFLRRSGKESTTGGCLRLVLSNTNAIWAYTWADSWITVTQILERLPSKDKKYRTGFWVREALYYAWKVGTAGVLPAMVAGNGVIDAGKASLKLLKDRPGAIMTLRTGYSIVCWVVGIASYILGVMFLSSFMNGMEQSGNESAWMFRIIVLTGGPVVIATGVVQMILRPIYLLAVTDVYCEELEKAGLVPDVAPMSQENFGIALAACATMCLCLIAAWLNADALGITEMLSTPYQ